MDISSARGALEVVKLPLPSTPEKVALDLESFAALLTKWQRAQNLVSRETLGEIWSRHVADSLQILNYWPENVTKIADLGSGGGFPSLPLAITLKGGPERFYLIESNSRKVAFLRAVIRELGLNAEIIASRAESAKLPGGNVDVVTARAVAALPKLLSLAAPFCGPETRLLLHKGREYGEELAATDAGWRFDVIEHRSVTEDHAVILEISGLVARTR